MEKYTAYKPSGIKWIGEIPEHWDVRYLFQVSNEHFISNKNLRHQNLLSLSYGKIVNKDINTTDGLLPATFDSYQIVEDGNIILRLTDLQNDHKSLRVGLVTQEGIITSAYVCLEAFDSILPKFLYYQLHSFDIKKVFYSMGGGLRQGLNYKELRKLNIILPPISEQLSIVAFLEKATANIDAYIKQTEQEINTLNELKQAEIAQVVTKGLNPNAPMKDSGIAWIGEIPEHWECEKLGKHFIQRKIKVSDKEYPALSVSKSGVTPQLETAVKTDNGDNRKLVKAGDFVVNSRSDRKGSCGFSQLDGSVSLINIVLTPIDVLPAYYHFLFRSYNYVEEFYRLGRGIVADLWTTRYTEMRSIMIPIPPPEEQQQIVIYIESKTSKIEEYITTLKSEIAQMQEYKQRLISDVVTGKMKV